MAPLNAFGVSSQKNACDAQFLLFKNRIECRLNFHNKVLHYAKPFNLEKRKNCFCSFFSKSKVEKMKQKANSMYVVDALVQKVDEGRGSLR